ncbi:hypothetical protein [Bradyrhizobium liaoningense]
MKSTSQPSSALPPAASFPIENEIRRFLASIASALRSSRRLQADRILRQYEHLIAHPKQSTAGPT